MPPEGSSAASAAPPLAVASDASPEQEPTWSRRDDKLLQLLLFARNAAIHDASNVLGKTPAQMQRRCSFMFEEIRRVLEALFVETPREWDDTEITAAAEAPVAAEEEEEAPGELVPVAQAQPVAAVAEDSAAATVAADGGGRSGNKPVRKKKKKAEKWTDDEHRFFLAGLDKYRGSWNVMSREYLTNKTASQIASHYQKYQKREKQRERNQCKRASIHDITEPGSVAAAAAAAAAAVRKNDDASTRGQDDEQRLEPAESGEGGPGPVEEFSWCR